MSKKQKNWEIKKQLKPKADEESAQLKLQKNGGSLKQLA